MMTKVAAALFGVLLIVAGPAHTQEDFRAADQDRPLQVEDAYPVKFLEWEWEAGTRGEIANGGRYHVQGVLELKTGIVRNVQLGFEVHPEWRRAAGASEAGVATFGAHLFYNVNQESRRAPAVAVRGDVWSPGVGAIGNNDASGRLRGILTRSFGRLRVHYNASYTWASVQDEGEFWSTGLGFDYPIGLFSKAVLGDAYLEVPTGVGDARLWTEIGARFQLTNSAVLDIALTTRVDEWTDGRPNIGMVFGLSRVFGIAGLVNVPPYPNPRLN